MLKMHSFDMNTRPETFVPLVHSVIDDTLSQATRPSSDAASVQSWTWWMSQMHAKEGHFSIECDSRLQNLFDTI